MHTTDFLFDREKPDMPSNVLSLMQLRTMPLHDQVKTLLTNGKQSLCGNIKKGVIHVSVWSYLYKHDYFCSPQPKLSDSASFWHFYLRG